MSGKPHDKSALIGLKYGTLLITDFKNGSGSVRIKVKAICICGSSKWYFFGNLTRGNTKSCGCQMSKLISAAIRTHGKTRTPEYGIWVKMKARCSRRYVRSYKYYGGKGIKVCARWLESFENFYKDMGPRPKDKHSIDRIDSSGDYEPNNCRWATWAEQGESRRKNRENFAKRT